MFAQILIKQIDKDEKQTPSNHLKISNDKPILFIPILGRSLKSTKAGLFLSQLLFWYGKGKNKRWIYKTIEEMEKETTLSRKEQDTAITICKKYGLIETKLKGIPAKRNFYINFEAIKKFVEEYVSSLEENDKQD